MGPGSVKSSHQTVSDYTLYQWFPNTIPVHDSRQAPRKISFILYFDTFHSWWCETCRVIRQQFWMRECDILGRQNLLWPLLHISGWSIPLIHWPTPVNMLTCRVGILVDMPSWRCQWMTTEEIEPYFAEIQRLNCAEPRTGAQCHLK